MRLSRLVSVTFVAATAAGATFIACGGGGGGGGNPDSKVYMDAKVPMDAPAGVTGLGQKCGSNLPACPANAPDCIGPQGSTQTWCTPQCETNGSGTSNGSGQLLLSAIMPPPSDTTCSGAFTGSAGTPKCVAIVASTPALGTTPNTHYTGINMDCLVECGTGSGTGPCPTGMTCTQGVCLPN